MGRPSPSIPLDMLSLVSSTLTRFETAAYRNEAAIAFLLSEQQRLREEWNRAEQELSDWENERERVKLELDKAAKEKVISGYLARMSKPDKEKALDLLSRLDKLKTGTVIHDEYEIELNRMFRFYDSI